MDVDGLSRGIFFSAFSFRTPPCFLCWARLLAPFGRASSRTPFHPDFIPFSAAVVLNQTCVRRLPRIDPRSPGRADLIFDRVTFFMFTEDAIGPYLLGCWHGNLGNPQPERFTCTSSSSFCIDCVRQRSKTPIPHIHIVMSLCTPCLSDSLLCRRAYHSAFHSRRTLRRRRLTLHSTSLPSCRLLDSGAGPKRV